MKMHNICPSSHPFAYLNGNYCCKTNKEKNEPHSDGELCNGSEISIESTCCEGDQHTDCPNPPCQNGAYNKINTYRLSVVCKIGKFGNKNNGTEN